MCTDNQDRDHHGVIARVHAVLEADALISRVVIGRSFAALIDAWRSALVLRIEEGLLELAVVGEAGSCSHSLL